jgi:hypothetical protein
MSQRSANRNSVMIAIDDAVIRLRANVSHRTVLPPVPDRLSPTSDGTLIAEITATSRRP